LDAVYKTVHRRSQQWCQDEVIRAALTDLANTLREQGEVDESECYIDASFASAKGGREQIGSTTVVRYRGGASWPLT